MLGRLLQLRGLSEQQRYQRHQLLGRPEWLVGPVPCGGFCTATPIKTQDLSQARTLLASVAAGTARDSRALALHLVGGGSKAGQHKSRARAGPCWCQRCCWLLQ